MIHRLLNKKSLVFNYINIIFENSMDGFKLTLGNMYKKYFERNNLFEYTFVERKIIDKCRRISKVRCLSNNFSKNWVILFEAKQIIIVPKIEVKIPTLS